VNPNLKTKGSGAMAKKHKGNWLVRIKASVDKEIYCEDCTQEEAENDPFEYAVDERELSQDDFEVIGVESTE
jgi:hypothetical protein